MAFVLADRIKETSTTTGTGTYDLAGAVSGFQTFVAGVATGSTCPYFAEMGADWEVGIGTVTDASPDTLARTTVLKSSNANAAVSWAAGTKTIALGWPADRAIMFDRSSLADGDFFRYDSASGLLVPKTLAAVNVALGLDRIFDLFGAPSTAFEFATSSLSGLTALSPTPDAESAHSTIPGHYYVRDDASGVSWCGRYASASAPFTAIALLSDHAAVANYNGACVFVGESTPGVLEVMGHGFNTGTVPSRCVAHEKYSNPTTYGGVTNYGPGWVEPPIYLAVRVNSTSNVDYLYSFCGRIWRVLVAARNPSITIGSVGVAMKSNNTGGASAAFDFLRIWTSALTFPGVP